MRSRAWARIPGGGEGSWGISYVDAGGRKRLAATNAGSQAEAEALAREIQAEQDRLRREISWVRCELGQERSR